MATRSSSPLGLSARKCFFIPSDSNWKSPVVSPRWNNSIVSLSSAGSASTSTSMPRNSFMLAKHSLITVSVLSPRKSIFRSPSDSTKWPSYCVVRSDSPSVAITGVVSRSGSRLMMMPHACTPLFLTEPHSSSARRSTRFVSSVPWSRSLRRSGLASYAFSNFLMVGSKGTIEASRLASGRGISSARATSFMLLRGARKLKVTMCPTCSEPYFSVTQSSTFWRPTSSKSTSISGIEMRSGFKNRSKSNPCFKGSTLVMRRQ